MDYSDSFDELTPELEMQKLVEENSKLEQEIKKLSFTSLNQRSAESSSTTIKNIANVTKPDISNDSVDNEVSFYDTSFKPLPFDKAVNTDDSLDTNDQSFSPVPISKQPIKKPVAANDGAHNEKYVEVQRKPGSPCWRKTNFSSFDDSKCPNAEKHLSKDSSRKKRENFDQAARRLVGEIAFQLDRRILQHIFSHRKRLYGFTVRNITEKIMEYTVDFQTGEVDEEKRRTLKEKRDNAFHFLQHNTGYNAKYHPIFSEMLVNKFGVLKINPKKSNAVYDDLQRGDHIKSIILHVLNPEYTYDALILLDALVLLSEFDGKPLLVW